MKNIKIVIEKHADGYIAYPVGFKGIVIGEGNTYEEALADIKSAIAFHIESFGKDALADDETPVIELFVAELAMAS
ncbi:MAG: type II toxin-antitoxin system HicB family antitoxin [Bacteroidota bacterium]